MQNTAHRPVKQRFQAHQDRDRQADHRVIAQQGKNTAVSKLHQADIAVCTRCCQQVPQVQPQAIFQDQTNNAQRSTAQSERILGPCRLFINVEEADQRVDLVSKGNGGKSKNDEDLEQVCKL